MVALSPARHRASDSAHCFPRNAHHCYATGTYYALTVSVY